MDWNGDLLRSSNFVSRPDLSFNFLYNYDHHHYPGMDMKNLATAETVPLAQALDRINYGCSQEKKKKLTNHQLESLERSFQEEVKLDPDRKMKLSRELGLQPRQIAVWFQNRRARWKAKQLERLYDALKQEFDIVSKEKLMLQEEVMKLKAMVREQGGSRNNMVQMSTGYTEMSSEKTVESTSVGIRHSGNGKARGTSQCQIAECGGSVMNNVDEYSNVPISSPYWAFLPAYP